MEEMRLEINIEEQIILMRAMYHYIADTERMPEKAAKYYGLDLAKELLAKVEKLR